MKKILFPALSAAFLFGAGLRAEPADHKGKDGGWEERHEARFKEMSKDLGLSADQEKKLEAHRAAHKETARALREQKRAKREALRAALQDPSTDETQVRALHGEVKDLERRLEDHRLEGILEVRKILTPEQFKKFHELMKEKMDGRRGKDHGPRGDRPRRGGPRER